jgi:hypothetical protein
VELVTAPLINPLLEEQPKQPSSFHTYAISEPNAWSYLNNNALETATEAYMLGSTFLCPTFSYGLCKIRKQWQISNPTGYWKGSKLELSQETIQLQGVATLPYASSRSYWPWHLVKSTSQGYMTGRQDSLATVGNLSEERNPWIKKPGPPS